MDAVSTGVAADRVVARDCDARPLRIRDADINAITGVAIDRVGRSVARHADDDRVDVVDIDGDTVTRQAVERAGQRDDRQIGVAVADVEGHGIVQNGVVPLGNQKGEGSGTLSIQSDAADAVVLRRDRVEAGGHEGPVVGFKIEAAAGVVVGRGGVEQQTSSRTGAVSSHEDTVEIEQGRRPIVVE